MSSATCTRCQPSAAAASAVSSVTENRLGTQPLRSHSAANARTASARSDAGPTGSPSPTATPEWRW